MTSRRRHGKRHRVCGTASTRIVEVWHRFLEMGSDPVYGPQRKTGGGTTSGGPGGGALRSGTKMRQLCSGCASAQNGVAMPTGTGRSDFDGRISRLASTTTVFLSASGAPRTVRYSSGVM